jgi:hypothetical protein
MSVFDTSTFRPYKPFTSAEGGTRYFEGIVVDNNDPKKRCRLKVSIIGLLEGKKALPWMYPLTPSGMGQSSTTGEVNIPEIGTPITCLFPFGSIYIGFYAWNTKNDTAVPDVFKTNYPDRYGSVDSTGYSRVVDKKALTVETISPDKSKLVVDSKNSIHTFTDDNGVEYTIDRKGKTIHLSFGGVVFNINGGKVSLAASDFDVKADNINLDCTSFTLKSSTTKLSGSSFTGDYPSVDW